MLNSGVCYGFYKDGKCSNPSTALVSKSKCCCFSAPTQSALMGWGSSCASCPQPGSQEYQQLCPHGQGFTNGGNDINECAQDPGILFVKHLEKNYNSITFSALF